MSRARNIKPGFFKNEVLADMPVEYRLLFIGLWCEADREGRLEYRPRRLKAAIFPYDDVDVSDGIAALVECGFLVVYDVGSGECIQILNWLKHQNPHHKEVASIIQAPENHVDSVCKDYVPLNNAIRSRIYTRDGRKCKQCGAEHGLSIDHIIPVSKGGNSVDDNLQVLCLSCNSRKGNKISCMGHPQAMHESSNGNQQSKQIASCPTDSLNLIPSSLIPDPLQELHAGIEDSCATIPDGLEAEAKPKRNPVPFQQIVTLYHETLPMLPKVEKLTDARKGYISARWHEDLKNLDEWRNFFGFVARSDFLTGRAAAKKGDRVFKADLEWITRPGNFAKIAEDKYHG